MAREGHINVIEYIINNNLVPVEFKVKDRSFGVWVKPEATKEEITTQIKLCERDYKRHTRDFRAVWDGTFEYTDKDTKIEQMKQMLANANKEVTK